MEIKFTMITSNSTEDPMLSVSEDELPSDDERTDTFDDTELEYKLSEPAWARYHKAIMALSKIHRDLFFACKTLLRLCDPLTQPRATEDFPWTLTNLSECYIGILYSNLIYTDPEASGLSIHTNKFRISNQIFQLFLGIASTIGPTDPELFKDMDALTGDDWLKQTEKWTPHIELLDCMKLCFTSASVLVHCLHLLFKNSSGISNVAVNPYSTALKNYWDIYSGVVVTSLHIDRRLENEGENTPDIIYEPLKAASLLRNVLAFCLNWSAPIERLRGEHNVNYQYLHDFETRPFSELFHPLERKAVGSLMKGHEPYQVLEFLRWPSDRNGSYEFGETIHPMNDEYDDDIRYIFEYSDEEEEEEPRFTWEQIKKITDSVDYSSGIPVPTANSFDVDVPLNAVKGIETVEEVFLRLVNDEKIGQWEVMVCDDVLNLLKFTAFPLPRAVLDLLFAADPPQEVVDKFSEDNLITPVLRVTYFELLLIKVPEFTRLMYEFLSYSAVEQSLTIWKICHQTNLSKALIDFVYSVLVRRPFHPEMGVQVNVLPNEEPDYAEVHLMIHEFLDGASDFLSAEEGINLENGMQLRLSPTITAKFVSYICLFIKKLLQDGLLGKETPDTLQVVLNFLFRFMTKSPEARGLYFEIKQITFELENKESSMYSQFLSEAFKEIHERDPTAPADYDQFCESFCIEVQNMSRYRQRRYVEPKHANTVNIFMDLFPIISGDRGFMKKVMEIFEPSPQQVKENKERREQWDKEQREKAEKGDGEEKKEEDKKEGGETKKKGKSSKKKKKSKKKH